MLSGISDAVNTPLYPPVANPPTQKWLHSTGRHPKPRVGLAATPAITAVLYTMGGPVQIHSFSAAQQGHLRSLGQISPPDLQDRSERL